MACRMPAWAVKMAEFRARACLPAVMLALCVTPAPLLANVYFAWQEDGVPAYSDRPLPGYALYYATDDLPATSPARVRSKGAWLEGMQRHAPLIDRVAAEHGLTPALLHAIVQVESGYDPTAVSPKGATGLMQLMPATARRYNVADRRDPLANLRGGARYLRDLLARFDGDLALALASYNAGEGAVLRFGRRIPPYAETVAYVQAVQRRYERLQR